MSQGGTISVVMARPVVAALQDRGVDPEPVMRAAQVSRDALGAIENRLPANSVRALWEEAAIATGDRSFGVHLAQVLPHGSLDVVEYIFATSQDVADGLSRLVKYTRLMEDPIDTRLVVEPHSARVLRHGALSTPQFDEFAMTLLLLRSRQACGVDWAPDSLRFEHADLNAELSRVFRCPVSFGAPHAELSFSHSVLELKFERSDSRLLAILERFATSLLDTLPNAGSLVARVSQAVAQQMGQGLPTLESTARALKTSQRTLQRQLADHGVSHSTLVDTIRRELALKHIGDASLSLTEISYILHFSDATAFYRAFKRWTGESPRRYRERFLFGRAS